MTQSFEQFMEEQGYDYLPKTGTWCRLKTPSILMDESAREFYAASQSAYKAGARAVLNRVEWPVATSLGHPFTIKVQNMIIGECGDALARAVEATVSETAYPGSA